MTPRAFDRSALEMWSNRLVSGVRRALGMRSALVASVEGLFPLENVSRFYGLDSAHHSMRDQPVGWLRITETQATTALKHFLEAGGCSRVVAFLRAIDPDIRWPQHFTSIEIDTEVPASTGRIDLLITARADDVTWGVIVEAKFNHHLSSNPLPAYARRGIAPGMRLKAAHGADATALLVVLGLHSNKATRRRLIRNKRWSFVGWHTLMRRWERNLEGCSDDPAFRQFRRMIWERAR